MFIFFYNLALFIYSFALRLVSPFHIKARKWMDGQRNIFTDLQTKIFNHTIWFHCASVGEFEQGYPLLEKMKIEYPSSTFFITLFSPSGYEYVKKKYPELTVSYLPIDSKKNAEKLIEIIKPKAVFFIKYEFWYYYLQTLKNKSIPVFLISGIFRENQLFFKWYGSLHREMLSCFRFLFLQNEESQLLLKSIEVNNCSITGDTRFDRVSELANMNFADTIVDDFTKHSNVFIAGSVWESDTEVLKQIISNLPSDWKILLAPHEPNTYSTDWLSEPRQLYLNYEHKNDSRILIINTIGILSKLYRKANFVYVGGGYGKSIHNILEAAIYEVPILIGPKFDKFNEAKELIAAGAVFCTTSINVSDSIHKLVSDQAYRESIQLKCHNYMTAHTNVSEKIMVLLKEQNLLN